MPPEEMGVYNIIAVTAAVVMPLFTLNLTDGTLIFFAQEKSKDKIQHMYMTVINSIGVWSVFLAGVGGAVIYIFRRDAMAVALWAGLMMLGQILYKISVLLFATYQKTDILLKNAFIRDIFIAVSAIGLLFLGFSYKGLVLASFLGFSIFSIYLYRLVFKKMSYSVSISFSYLRQFMKIALPLLPVFFFSWIIRSSDTYFLVYFKGEDVVGKYSVIYGLCNVILIFTYALHFFWFPVSAKLWKENRDKYRKAYIPFFTGFITLLSVSVILFEFNSKFIMNLLIRRPEYHEAYVIMGIIAFAFSMQVLITLLTAPLYSNKNPNMIFASYFSGALLNCLLNFLLIPPLGFLGAAVSTAISYLAIVLLMTYLNHRVAGFFFLDKRLVYVVPAFAGLWVGVRFMRERLQTTQILVGDVVLVLVLGLVIYFVGMRREEKMYVWGFLKDFKAGKFFKNK